MATVLLLHRNALHRRVLTCMLRRHDHTVVSVSDSVEALEQLGRRGYDLLIVDVALKGVEDFITLQRVLAGRASRQPPTLVITDNGRAADRRRALSAGASCVLTYPFSVADLGAMVTILTGEVKHDEDDLSITAARLGAHGYHVESEAYQQVS